MSDEPETVIQPTTDNGGRRSGIERRSFSYTVHVPERRSGTDRRTPEDRRKTLRRQQPDGGGVAL